VKDCVVLVAQERHIYTTFLGLPEKAETIETFACPSIEEELVETSHLELVGEVNLVGCDVLVEGLGLSLRKVLLREAVILADLCVHEVSVVRLNGRQG
jgi:hypothetical protein